ncbi:MAG: L,D-transpeptidase [Hyphomicrobiaceae bacterium]
MFRIILVAGFVAAFVAPASAQSRSQAGFDTQKPRAKAKKTKTPNTVRRTASASSGLSFFELLFSDDDDDDYPSRRTPARPSGPKVADGGPRPEISPRAPSVVAFHSGQAPGTVVIDTSARRLFLVQSGSRALSYPVSVGREGFSWTGTEKITRMANWPDWHPPAEMRARDPRLPEKMTGGVRNPLGAKALYLGNTLYRIHGTSDARSIGRAASSGCFRMHNSHVVDLAGRVGIGTKVVVVRSSRAVHAAQN